MGIKLYGYILFFFVLACSRHVNNENGDKVSDEALLQKIELQEQYALGLVKNLDASGSRVFPRSLTPEGEIRRVPKKDWTSGFYPGILWMMYELTEGEEWKQSAIQLTELLENQKFDKSTHDLGFIMMSSYGLAYKLTGNKEYRDVLIQSARSLITRFNENTGCIRSWDHNRDKWDYPVIIDNMMNLELLFFASKETGDPVFENIAIKHAQTTLKNHFRSDFSTYHVVAYDTITGAVVAQHTHQGYAHESTWARGQAWALYGYTMAYRETHLPEFLSQAEKVANYIFNKAGLPEDNIPYWDFNAPNIPNEPRDVSAAAIMASALYELSTLSDGDGITYVAKANDIMEALVSDAYFNEEGTNGGFLLRHSTGAKPKKSEVDVPLVYADYYFLEALLRKKSATVDSPQS